MVSYPPSEGSAERERFLALYMIASGQRNASQWAAEIGRENESVMNWVHLYNQSRSDTLIYRRTGGIAPFWRRGRSKRSWPSSTPTR
jgi:hypothetical protein